MKDANPQEVIELREVARHLLQHPLTCSEHDPDIFRLIRKHEVRIDRWFTKRLGYRLEVTGKTARLYKITYVPENRPMRVAGGSSRELTPLEHTMLALLFAATSSGSSVVSLRDLVADVRSAAAEAEIDLAGDGPERRALVKAIQWMIEHGLAVELHDRVEAYTADESADAVLQIRPERIALLPLPVLASSQSVEQLIDRTEHRNRPRQWLRARLAEDPVLYQDDCTAEEWSGLRRRLAEESAKFDEMFGLSFETRAEGIAAIDPTGRLSDQRFPAAGTRGHASLLLIEHLTALREATCEDWVPMSEVVTRLQELSVANSSLWSADSRESPERLADQVIAFLCDLRLMKRQTVDLAEQVCLLPAASRYTIDPQNSPEPEPTLW